MRRLIFGFGVLILAAQPASGQAVVVPQAKTTRSPSLDFARALVKDRDQNGDGRLNVDEAPGFTRKPFAGVDTNRDGYLDVAEVALALDQGDQRPIRRGHRIADKIHLVADDFVVDIWQNGVKVPDARRTLVSDTFGAIAETVTIDLFEGDWLVFQVANNRLRWGGAAYFGVAGIRTQGDPSNAITLVSQPGSDRWSVTEDPGLAPWFTQYPDYLAHQTPRPIAQKWSEGDARMNQLADGWKGAAIWGDPAARVAWFKYVAPAPTTPQHVTSFNAAIGASH